MNRMKLGPIAALPQPSYSDSSTSSTATKAFQSQLSRAQGMEHTLVIPMHYESSHAYPLIVWLHSSNDDQRQINEVLPKISERNYVGVSVRGPDNHSNGKYCWLQSPDSIETSSNHVSQAIDLATCRLNINPQRVFIAGQGNGGTMAFRLAFEFPSLFAGVASVNGSLPANLNPLRNWLDSRGTPVFWTHGRRSDEFPESNLCHQLRLLHIAGFAVTLRQYPCDNIPSDQIFSDLDIWMMKEIAKSSDSNIIC